MIYLDTSNNFVNYKTKDDPLSFEIDSLDNTKFDVYVQEPARISLSLFPLDDYIYLDLVVYNEKGKPIAYIDTEVLRFRIYQNTSLKDHISINESEITPEKTHYYRPDWYRPYKSYDCDAYDFPRPYQEVILDHPDSNYNTVFTVASQHFSNTGDYKPGYLEYRDPNAMLFAWADTSSVENGILKLHPRRT